MKTLTLAVTLGSAIMIASCNSSSTSPAVETTALSVEDSTALDAKLNSEALQQEVEELDKEIDSLVNSLN